MTRKPPRAARAAPAGRGVPALAPIGAAPLALVAVVAAACVIAAVTFRIYDPDLWQHLTVGRAIWQSHAIPHTQLWSWPTYGAPDVLPSWLYRAVLWPFYAAGGVPGVFAFRWVTAFATFALLWAAARRAGATGVAPLFALVWCALLYRARSQARPETFVMVFAALELFVLEARRRGARLGRLDPAWAIVPIAWIWANAHLSYYLAFVIAGGYLLDALWRGRRDAAAAPGTLAFAMAAGALACFANPFGWKALWQPFDYFFHGRQELIYRSIAELAPIEWSVNVRNALPAFLALFAVALVARGLRRGWDAAELAIVAVALPQTLASQRFLGYFAVLVAPFFARNVADLAGAVRWPAPLAAPWSRAALAAAACVLLALPSLGDPAQRPSFGTDPRAVPERAVDWMERHDVRGRGFNTFAEGGYLLWRFWPDTTRLPFMDIHQAGTPEIRNLYTTALARVDAWRELERRYEFDWVLLPRGYWRSEGVGGYLDADTNWHAVFVDDAGVLFLRRDGRMGPLAERLGFRALPASDTWLGRAGARAASDTAFAAAMRRELERSLADSPLNSRAHSLLANLDLLQGRIEDGERHLREALAIWPLTGKAHDRLAQLRLLRGDAAGALAEYRLERRVTDDVAAAETGIGAAWKALGHTGEARAAWKRALRASGANGAALAESLATLR